MTKFHYSVVRLVPDPIRGEFINVGVIVVSGDPTQLPAARFVGGDQWKRIRRFAGNTPYDVISAVRQDVARDSRPARNGRLLGPPAWSVDELDRLSREWANTIQLTGPLAAVAATAGELADRLYNRYVDRGVAAPEENIRDKNWLKNYASGILNEELQPPEGRVPAHWPEVVSAPAGIRGEKDVHRFDLGIKNGKVQHLFDLISFEIKSRDQLSDTIAARKWAIADTRSKEAIPISVLVIGQDQAPVMFNSSKHVYEDLGATVVVEPDIEGYLHKASVAALAESKG